MGQMPEQRASYGQRQQLHELRHLQRGDQQPLGSSGSERWASASSSQVSTDGLLRTYNYTAKVLTSRATPPAGTYTDTLIVDVAF